MKKSRKEKTETRLPPSCRLGGLQHFNAQLPKMKEDATLRLIRGSVFLFRPLLLLFLLHHRSIAPLKQLRYAICVYGDLTK